MVYEGAQLPIGCQFSFTCDGSLARPPIEPYWSRAKFVAEAALDGFVARNIGSATHYHADYVFPRWGPQMVKIVQLGAHIFYRYPRSRRGPRGLLAAMPGASWRLPSSAPGRRRFRPRTPPKACNWPGPSAPISRPSPWSLADARRC
ncbi:MAG: cell wall hydrolase [Caulobacteraceae bacterium]